MSFSDFRVLLVACFVLVVCEQPARCSLDLPGELHQSDIVLDFGYRMILEDGLIPVRQDTGHRTIPFVDTITSFEVLKILPGQGSCLFLQCSVTVERKGQFSLQTGVLDSLRLFAQLYRTCDGGLTIEHVGTIGVPAGYLIRDMITDANHNPVLGFDPVSYYQQNGKQRYHAITKRYDQNHDTWDSEYARATTYWAPEGNLNQPWWRSQDTGALGSHYGTVDGGVTFSDNAPAGLARFGWESDSIKFAFGKAYRQKRQGLWRALDADVELKSKLAWFHPLGLLIGRRYVIDGDFGVTRSEEIDPTQTVVDGTNTWFGTSTDGTLFFLNENYQTDSISLIYSTDLGFSIDTALTAGSNFELEYSLTYGLGPGRCFFIDRHVYDGSRRDDPWYEEADTVRVFHYVPSEQYPKSIRWPRHLAGRFNTPVKFICPAQPDEIVEIELTVRDSSFVRQSRGPSSTIKLRSRYETYGWRYRIQRNGSWTVWSSKWLLKTGSLVHWTPLENPYLAERFDEFTIVELSDGLLVCIGKNLDSVVHVSSNQGVDWKPLTLGGHLIDAGMLHGVGAEGVICRTFDPSDTVNTRQRTRFVSTTGGSSYDLPIGTIKSTYSTDSGTIYTSHIRHISRSRDLGKTWDSLAIPGRYFAPRVTTILPSGELFVSIHNERSSHDQPIVDTVGFMVDTSTFSISGWMVAPAYFSVRGMIDPVFVNDSVWLCLVKRRDNYVFLGRTTNAGRTWTTEILPLDERTTQGDPPRMAMVKDSLIILHTSVPMGTFDGTNWFRISSGVRLADANLSANSSGSAYTRGLNRALLMLLDVGSGESTPLWSAGVKEKTGDKAVDTNPERLVSGGGFDENLSLMQQSPVLITENAYVTLPDRFQNKELLMRVYDNLGQVMFERSLAKNEAEIALDELGLNRGLYWVLMIDITGEQAPYTLRVLH